ncbi:hypothetical protein AA0113_g10073 [Alternaria arborescens]|uniref:HpcH/HpaI aldolase/citrate lyase domain-containing protein n=1 Tax=Alternaria arborescens TaxID=156630 RepID=A0A4Q4QXD0_9PLEO|nr:hypothetical protein AA0111_g4972 [Alternaria arborescens]RYO31643.1 hypothetical protein AA0111_g4972 [Alternaria arborescens]RYO48424.1 hypothetical protein AA0113_g10073 [Alternaria arborescens]
MASSIAPNNLLSNAAQSRICTAFGIKITPDTSIVHIAKAAGYDSLFIDLEHTAMTIKDANQLCITANSAGITPFVRVPHQCGNGIPLESSFWYRIWLTNMMLTDDALRAINISKYPPMGKRSISAGFPHFEFAPVPTTTMTAQMNTTGSTVFIMIETADALAAVDDIAALAGADVLLVGSNDLASEIGTLGDWDAPCFLAALEKVGAAARKHGKIMGIAGLYHRPDILERVINEFGAKWVVGAQDVGLLLQGGTANSALLRSLQK